MKENWDRAIASIFVWEGGNAVRENEPGGAVSRGCSLAVYREEHPGASINDLFEAPDDVIKSIYARRYAKPIGFDDLPAGLDVAMLHAAVMFGVGGATKMLAATMVRAEKHGLSAGEMASDLVIRLMQNKMHRQDGLRFMPGWSDRFVSVNEIAQELVKPPRG